MGLSLFNGCYTSPTITTTPNPDPSRWRLVDSFKFKNAHVLIVKYLDCTNFEGLKCMVFKGPYEYQEYLDPHFSDDRRYSPIARFRPDAEGIELAKELAKKL